MKTLGIAIAITLGLVSNIATAEMIYYCHDKKILAAEKIKESVFFRVSPKQMINGALYDGEKFVFQLVPQSIEVRENNQLIKYFACHKRKPLSHRISSHEIDKKNEVSQEKTYEIHKNEDISHAMQSWFRHTKWQLMFKPSPRISEIDVGFTGTLEQVVEQLIEALEREGVYWQAIFYEKNGICVISEKRQ